MKVDNALSIGVYRNYSMLNQLVSSSAHKFALGKNTATAADDPAGMAFSARITTEVRGINVAVRNTQDAASLLETAGSADRGKLSEEFQQMKRQINDVARQTTFSNMRILDGAFSSEGVRRSANTEGIYVEKQQRTQEAVFTQEVMVRPYQAAEGTSVEAVVDLGRLEVQNASADEIITINLGDTSIAASLKAGTNTAADIARSMLDAEGVTYEGNVAIDGYNYAMDVENTVELRLQLTEESVQATEQAAAQLQDMSVSVGYTAADGGAGAGAMNYAQDVAVSTSAPAVQQGGGYVKTNIVRFNSSLKIGDTFRVSGKTFELVVPGGLPKNQGASTISLFAAQTSQDIVQAMRDAMSVQLENALRFEAMENELTIEQQVPDGAGVEFTMNPAQHSATTVEFDINRLKSGDQLTLHVADADGQVTSNSYVHIRGNTPSDMAGILMQGTNGVLEGPGAMRFEDSDVSVEFDPVLNDYGRELLVQVGAGESEQLKVGIDAMNTAGLRLDSVNLDTQEAAGQAAASVQNALQSVLSQSATMGAAQNRLQHKMSNLQQSTINATESDSRIADVDIAEEMMKNTLLGIQQQANVAMQAQANSKSRNVLTLLM